MIYLKDVKEKGIEVIKSLSLYWNQMVELNGVINPQNIQNKLDFSYIEQLTNSEINALFSGINRDNLKTTKLLKFIDQNTIEDTLLNQIVKEIQQRRKENTHQSEQELLNKKLTDLEIENQTLRDKQNQLEQNKKNLTNQLNQFQQDKKNLIIQNSISDTFSSPKVKTSTQEVEKYSVPQNKQENGMSLNQSDLAQRLEVHPSTVEKRKSDRDFCLWSQSRDPDGIFWQYIEKSKTFIPKNTE